MLPLKFFLRYGWWLKSKKTRIEIELFALACFASLFVKIQENKDWNEESVEEVVAEEVELKSKKTRIEIKRF